MWKPIQKVDSTPFGFVKAKYFSLYKALNVYGWSTSMVLCDSLGYIINNHLNFYYIFPVTKVSGILVCNLPPTSEFLLGYCYLQRHTSLCGIN